jgi:hypothetical protein
MLFEVLDMDRNDVEKKIGSVNFPLTKIENQEEYEVLLEIQDERDDSIVNAKINAKIKFYWSNYKYYEDLYNSSEKKVNNLKIMLDKSNQLLDNLNGIFLLIVEPFKNMTAVKQIIEEPQPQYVPPEPLRVEQNNKKQARNNLQTIEEQVAYNIETIIKSKFSNYI